MDWWVSQLYCPQVRELEKQLGQRQNKTTDSSSSEIAVSSDPRKLTAQEKNLLRIRSLERDKLESWEVRRAQPLAAAHRVGRSMAPIRRRPSLIGQDNGALGQLCQQPAWAAWVGPHPGSFP